VSAEEVINIDEEKEESDNGDNEAEEANAAVKMADADMGNPVLAKLAQEKINNLEKRIVIMSQ
jgi:hypothetical protein